MTEEENMSPEKKALLDLANDVIARKHAVFVNQMIVHGDRTVAYQAAYPNASADAAYTGACRLLRDPIISGAIQIGLHEARRHCIEVLKERSAGKMLDLIDKRALLTELANGRIPLVRHTEDSKGQSRTTTITDPIVRLRAIRLDNQLEKQWQEILPALITSRDILPLPTPLPDHPKKSKTPKKLAKTNIL